MTMRLTIFLCALAAGCGDSGSGGSGCDAAGCDADCQAGGYAGGLCEDDGSCICVGGDADTDSDTDTDTDADTDTGTDTGSGFTNTPGTQAEVDRTEPCDPAVDVEPGYAPQDGETIRFCFPNYNVWAPLECGNNPWDLPDTCDETGCSSSYCLGGEAAKWVGPGAGVCACFNLCTTQEDGARCGAADERPCVPIDDAEGAQVFICGAEL